MRVFHGPIEIAGQMGTLSTGLRMLGMTVDSYNCEKNYLQYRNGITNIERKELQKIFNQNKRQYDIFHFHYARSITDDNREFIYIKKRNKVRLMHFWGNDVRTSRIAVANNPYIQLSDHFLSEAYIKKRLCMLREYFDACIVQDFEVVPYVVRYFKRIYVLPLAIDLRQIQPQYVKTTDPIYILHAPTLPNFKGTEYIEETLERLRENGYHFHYQRVQEMAHDQAISLYQKADLIIDQILSGTYGVLAVEAMALGKPVISYIRQDLKKSFDTPLPIISANPATLYQKIKRMLTNPSLLTTHGEEGRKYVETYHDVKKIANGLAWIYQLETMINQDQTWATRHKQGVYQVIYPTVRVFDYDSKTRCIKTKSAEWNCRNMLSE